MIPAYAETYLRLSRQCMGSAFDYATHGLGLPLREFYDLFLASPLSVEMASGNPKVVAGTSGEELALELLGEQKPLPWREAPSPSREYWAGLALARFQWMSGLSFQEIDRLVPLEFIVSLYDPYHEMDIKQLDDKLVSFVTIKKEKTHLASLRKKAGMSQNDLAVASGVSKRTIQQYEQGQKSINQASVSTIEKFARVLGCDISDLMESCSFSFAKRPRP